MLALVDVNNFYVSCERLFNPRLIDKPVVVLSNNDGCIISRSNEAKLIGIKMGQPLFKVQSLINQYQVKVLSSNYSLYADISSRAMRLIAEFTNYQEVYSIDECFINLSKYKNPQNVAIEIKEKLWMDLRMPVCVGIGSTKVLAKFANHCAKKQKNWNGVCASYLITKADLDALMNKISVSEVWGIGKKLTQQLEPVNIKTVLDLKDSNISLVKNISNVNVARIIYELNGIKCFPLELKTLKKKQIITSRSFGKVVTNYQELIEAVTTFVVRASVKLRKQDSLCRRVSVFIQSSPFKKDSNYYHNLTTIPLTYPASNTALILENALKALHAIYKENIAYIKCGVILSDLINAENIQNNLWALDGKRKDEITFLMDKINNRFNSLSLRLATQPLSPLWGMRQLKKSPAYTTSWRELLVVD